MNSVIHFELPADSLPRAKSFYEKCFGWGLQDMPMGEETYVMAMTTAVDEKQMPKKPGAINGGITNRGGSLLTPSFSINVDDIEETLAHIKEAGGTVMKEKTPVGDMGFVAYFKDTEDNVLSLWENA